MEKYCLLIIFLLVQMSNISKASPYDAQTPYLGTSWILPSTIEAENFDNGGEGVAYHDTDPVNTGGLYRTEGVDIGSTYGENRFIGWIEQGEWLEYTCNGEGAMYLDVIVGSPVSTGVVHVEYNGVDITGPITVPNTGGLNNYTPIRRLVFLPSNSFSNILRVVADEGGFAFDKMAFYRVDFVSGLRGNYFNNLNFSDAQLSRVDPELNFNWHNGSPDLPINADNFTARWEGKIIPRHTETYTFHLTSDNGRRLYINEQMIIDKWIDDWDKEYTATIDLIAGQFYDIKVEYFEKVGGANIKLEWSSASQIREVIPASVLFSVPKYQYGSGLTGTYYNGINFNTPALIREDSVINFNWGGSAPDPTVNSDRFSVRWKGKIVPLYSEEYTFYANTDNGRKLTVAGLPIINKMVDDWNIEYQGKIKLKAGSAYNIILEYFENVGGASAKLEWSSPSQAREVIPASRLFPNVGEGQRLVPAVAETSASTNKNAKLKLYPNPGNHRFTLEIDGKLSNNIQAIVRNSAGVIVHTEKLTSSDKVTVNTSKLKAGIYTITIDTGNGLVQEKFIIAD